MDSLGRAFLAKTVKSPGAPPAEHLIFAAFLAHPPTVIPAAAFVKEWPLVPCGPALLQ